MPARNARGQFTSDGLSIPLPGFLGIYKILIIIVVLFPWYCIISNRNIANILFGYLIGNQKEDCPTCPTCPTCLPNQFKLSEDQIIDTLVEVWNKIEWSKLDFSTIDLSKMNWSNVKIPSTVS